MRFDGTPAVITEEAIIAFARQFDPQYYHVDPVAARRSEFGGLIASGFHTLNLCFRQFFDLNLWPNAVVASPGMSDVSWKAPLRPGDMLTAAAEVIELRPSRSKPDRGVIVMRHTAANQTGREILSVVCLHLVRRRPAAQG
ncbi:MAG: MaoC family dehydratase [Pseudolabrys sp.]